MRAVYTASPPLSSCVYGTCDALCGALSSFAGNALRGTLPEQWSLLTALTKVQLLSNNVLGTLPPSWSALSNLAHLDLSTNPLSGTLPAPWSRLTALTQLILDEAKLTGVLVSIVCFPCMPMTCLHCSCLFPGTQRVAGCM